MEFSAIHVSRCRPIALLCLAVGLARGAGDEQAPNTLTASERRAGWALLFDGTSMQGWDDPRRKVPPGDAWTIEDACLKANARPRITEDLFTTDKYEDFELVFDWRISRGGNSGVKYRIQDHWFVTAKDPGSGTDTFEQRVEQSFQVRRRLEKGQDYVIGFEYQITDDGMNRDARNHLTHTAGALYDVVAPSTHATRPVGEFNHSRILVRGNRVEHWMNGVKVVDAALDSAQALQAIGKRWRAAPHVEKLLATQPNKACPISLQNHDDAAWFRNIKIRRLNSH
jgi:hypothetical protein